MTPYEARSALRSQAEACRARALDLCPAAAHYILVAAEKLERAAVLALEAELLTVRGEERELWTRQIPDSGR